MKFKTTNNMLLITQDKKLSRDIDNLNNQESVKGKQVRARYINKFGFLSSNFKFEDNNCNNSEISHYEEYSIGKGRYL